MNDDVIIIGTGQAGVPLATRLAAAGKNVRIVERAAAGGTCVNVGCTPTKTMVASARAAQVARTAGRLGVRVAGVEVDFSAVVARKDAMVQRWRQGVEHRLATSGQRLQFIRGHARFVDAHTVEVAGTRYQAETIVINVGARASLPTVGGLASVPHLNSSSVLSLRSLPRHLVVLGGGYVGCELGQMFRRFGAAVTIINPAPHILPREDTDVSEALETALRAEDVSLTLGRRVEGARAEGDDIVLTLADGGEVSAGGGAGGGIVPGDVRGSHLLVATGRRPNTDDLDCDRAGIALDGGGYVVVDERYETSTRGVFAAGDCTPGPQFTHVSWDDHRVLFDVLMGRPARRRSERLVPYTVFTDPQVAGVGLSEREARRRGIAVEVATMPFAKIARALETDQTAGLVKVLLDPSTEQLVGAFVVGSDAGELIHVFSVLMQAKVSARAIVDGEFVHPTFAEGLQTAVMTLPRYALS